MTARTPPRRHWRSYGTDPLPTGPEALDEPFTAFPSWFVRIECDRCGKVQMVSEAHMKRGAMPIRDIIARMRHDGCGGRAGKARCRCRRVQRYALARFASTLHSPPPTKAR
jgi:hypothetical protein